jgi:20S proteasome subunit beta 1
MYDKYLMTPVNGCAAGVIIGGWDPKDGGQVYTVTLGGTLQRQKFSIGGE